MLTIIYTAPSCFGRHQTVGAIWKVLDVATEQCIGWCYVTLYAITHRINSVIVQAEDLMVLIPAVIGTNNLFRLQPLIDTPKSQFP
jgi:hypothetical protein